MVYGSLTMALHLIPSISAKQYSRFNSVMNSLSPRSCGHDFKCVNFKHNLRTDILSIQINIMLDWITEDFFGDKSTLFQVMVWCRQATNPYLSKCWPRSRSPYSVGRPQWVDSKSKFRFPCCCSGRLHSFHSMNMYVQRDQWTSSLYRTTDRTLLTNGQLPYIMYRKCQWRTFTQHYWQNC